MQLTSSSFTSNVNTKKLWLGYHIGWWAKSIAQLVLIYQVAKIWSLSEKLQGLKLQTSSSMSTFEISSVAIYWKHFNSINTTDIWVQTELYERSGCARFTRFKWLMTKQALFVAQLDRNFSWHVNTTTAFTQWSDRWFSTPLRKRRFSKTLFKLEEFKRP